MLLPNSKMHVIGFAVSAGTKTFGVGTVAALGAARFFRWLQNQGVLLLAKWLLTRSERHARQPNIA